MEVKGTAEPVQQTAAGEQVRKYAEKYGLVLVTNYRDFALVQQDGTKPVVLEQFRLAESEVEFWHRPVPEVVAAHGAAFEEFLKRSLLQNAPLTTPEEVAWILTSYARAALANVEGASHPALESLKAALSEGLGMRFEGAKGEHFFRSTLVQTLFYGVFSAWVLWHHEDESREDDFDWRVASHYLHVPVIQALFWQVSDPSKLRALGLMS